MSRFVLKFLWLEKSIAVGLDQRIGEKTCPLTEYFFWPRSDSWEDMRIDLSLKPWISQNDSILILNQITEVINYWQEKSESSRKKDLQKVKEKFPDCIFIGRD
uniref:putative ribosomal protein PSRP-3/Ycf65 n=1 Tax=Phacus arnoldii TaxID=298292 RepID=UPI0023AADE3F|nr:putative ribosomal protein PSRP-3/Ycf65 [Phacus arnoldii]WCH63564.1 putative ribosomal protein PSRP-3/Ycf65 [Phacus arnoldii]